MRNASIDTRTGGRIGFWERAFGGIVEARSRQANREIADFLRSYDDATLATFGYRRVVARDEGKRAAL
jgi:hypothetical protein